MMTIVIIIIPTVQWIEWNILNPVPMDMSPLIAAHTHTHFQLSHAHMHTHTRVHNDEHSRLGSIYWNSHSWLSFNLNSFNFHSHLIAFMIAVAWIEIPTLLPWLCHENSRLKLDALFLVGKMDGRSERAHHFCSTVTFRSERANGRASEIQYDKNHHIISYSGKRDSLKRTYKHLWRESLSISHAETFRKFTCSTRCNKVIRIKIILFNFVPYVLYYGKAESSIILDCPASFEWLICFGALEPFGVHLVHFFFAVSQSILVFFRSLFRRIGLDFRAMMPSFHIFHDSVHYLEWIWWPCVASINIL